MKQHFVSSRLHMKKCSVIYAEDQIRIYVEKQIWLEPRWKIVRRKILADVVYTFLSDEHVPSFSCCDYYFLTGEPLQTNITLGKKNGGPVLHFWVAFLWIDRLDSPFLYHNGLGFTDVLILPRMLLMPNLKSRPWSFQDSPAHWIWIDRLGLDSPFSFHGGLTFDWPAFVSFFGQPILFFAELNNDGSAGHPLLETNDDGSTPSSSSPYVSRRTGRALSKLHISTLNLISPFYSSAGGPAVNTEGGPSVSKPKYVHSEPSLLFRDITISSTNYI